MSTLFWVGATANTPKSDDKYALKVFQLVRGSSFRSDFLQNPYFKGGAAHLSGKIVMHDQIKTIDGEDMQKLISMDANTLKRDHPHIMSAFFWFFSDYTLYEHKYSTERQHKLPFS